MRCNTMLKILIIFALLFASSEETNQTRLCGLMISFSDANPVQFWPDYCDTYNESEVCGIHDACWCQPFNCDDEIVIQFTDNTVFGEPIGTMRWYNYYLKIFDSNNSLIRSEPFAVSNTFEGSQVIQNKYTFSFVPQAFGICDEQVSMKIQRSSVGDEEMENNGYWQEVSSDSGSSWSFATVGDDHLLRVTVNSTTNSKRRRGEFTGKTGTSYSFDYSATTSAGGCTVKFQVTLYNSETLESTTVDSGDILSSSVTSGTITFPALTHDADTIFLKVVYSSAPIDNTTFSLDTFYDNSSDYVELKSDCLDIRTFHNCTKLIEYSNSRNFAGLKYVNSSPNISFYIRVPCRFFHQRFPEEAQGIELIDQITITSQQLKAQKLMEIMHAPYYFHRKLKLVLMHQSLEIDNTLWKREEAYEINEGNKRWPLKSATCYLTEKNSVVRNVL